MSRNYKSPLVFLVGHFLDPKEAARDIPGALPVGWGTLGQSKLSFRGWVSKLKSPALGVSFSENEGDKVQGMVFRMSKRNLEILDGFFEYREGQGGVKRELQSIELIEEHPRLGKQVEAFVYYSGSIFKKPSTEYSNDLFRLYWSLESSGELMKAFFEASETMELEAAEEQGDV